ncbi:hypothetical protein E3N88_18067 [Mikania micrantha]|uniref:Integrase catalytic domain-containing protein n=1 Tax=Mikania micrantha TaxID=192012 RepID=A0A5N6NTS0_9ASTR|nr:hypothetical protein E3N88_18067 [Mikania micrantha]
MAANNNNANPNVHNLSLRTILEKERLNHGNFMDWYRNLRIVLKQEKKSYVLDDPIPDQPDEDNVEAFNDWVKYVEDSVQVSCLMLAIEGNVQQQSRVERFKAVRALHACRMDETQLVSSYVLKMKSHIDRLERLNCRVSNELATDLILNSLSKRFESFVMNYNMNGWDKSIGELHSMLKTAEAGMGKKVLPVLTINEGGNKKRNHPDPKASVAKGKGHVKGKGKGKAKMEPTKPKEKKQKVAKDDPCFECGEIGHWKRNCPVYLKELKAKRDAGQTTGTNFMIQVELNVISSNTWVLDTGCGTHICNLLQGFKRSEHYAKGEISLFMGNGAKVHVEAQGDYVLKLPSGLEVILKNILYAPSLTRNIISVSLLRQYGYDFKFVDIDIHVSLNHMFYFKAKPCNGIYELVHDNTTYDSSMYQATTKRLKLNLSDSYLWHCRLGHINKNHMQKLQKNGLLKKMKMIHLMYASLVYKLLGHKHESFEMFKIFKNEVENQLNKTVKILRTDRGGEYLSSEFQEYLRSCGIVSQLTPPGTPQHNGVSERRNRTLLDMVRSMMARSTLPLSFWGFALLSAARILNMAPTKKVERTPFEIWHGKVPSLSYLKVWGCEAYPKQYTQNKLEARSTKCIFVGYPRDCMGYYFYDPTEQKVFIARKAEFLETKFLSEGTSGRTVELEEVQDSQDDTHLVDTSNQHEDVENDHVDDQDTQNVRRSGRISVPPERYGFFMDGCYVADSDEPTTYRDCERRM